MSKTTISNNTNGALDLVFARGGEAGTLMRSLDWTQTPLGAVEYWPHSLRTTVSIVLTSKLPMLVFWGAEAIQFYNDAFISIFGDQHPDAMGRPARATWAARWADLVNLLAMVRSTGEAVITEDLPLSTYRPDVTEKSYFTVSYSPVHDENANVQGILATVVEPALRITASAEQKRVNNLLNNASDAVVVLDRDYRFTYLNSHAQDLYFRLTGQPKEAFLGKVIWDKFPDSQASSFGEAYRRAMQKRIPLTIESLFESLNRWFEVRLYPVDEGLSIYFQDITGRKQAEKVLQENAHDLKRSNEDLERFAYIASHDLQGPLRIVTSFLQLLQTNYQHVLDQDGRDFIEFALSGAASGCELITDLLAYTRVKTDERTFVTFSSEIALKTAMKNLHAEIEECQARIKFDHLPTITGNKHQFVQVFQNLLSNAIKFRSKNTPEISVSAHRHNAYWQFAVQDNGIGIEQEYFDRIFVMFQRLHLKEQYPGTGMGLAICKKVIESHRGHIWVESKLGEGATFYFTAPAEQP